MRESEAARYVSAICLELEHRREYLRGATVSTVYFGGGTPSRLTPDQIGQVIDCIRVVFGLDDLIELTVECNPDDITPGYVTALRDYGVNRISMGVQTFNDDLLRFLGRRHTAAQAVEAVNICLKAGIENISIDLMYGLPGQTPDIQQNDLDFLTSLGENRIPFTIIYTKCDKLSQTAFNAQLERNKALLSEQWEPLPDMLSSSSQNGKGKEEILDYIEDLIKSLK